SFPTRRSSDLPSQEPAVYFSWELDSAGIAHQTSTQTSPTLCDRNTRLEPRVAPSRGPASTRMPRTLTVVCWPHRCDVAVSGGVSGNSSKDPALTSSAGMVMVLYSILISTPVAIANYQGGGPSLLDHLIHVVALDRGDRAVPVDLVNNPHVVDTGTRLTSLPVEKHDRTTLRRGAPTTLGREPIRMVRGVGERTNL